MPDGVRQYGRDHVEVRAHLAQVGYVHSQRQRSADHGVIVERSQGLLDELLSQRITSPHVDAESQVGAYAAKRRRSVEVSARKIEAVSRLEHRLDERRLLGPLLNVGLPVVPGLVTQRRLQDRPVDSPLLLSFDLEDEHVVYVVVSAE